MLIWNLQSEISQLIWWLWVIWWVSKDISKHPCQSLTTADRAMNFQTLSVVLSSEHQKSNIVDLQSAITGFKVEKCWFVIYDLKSTNSSDDFESSDEYQRIPLYHCQSLTTADRVMNFQTLSAALCHDSGAVFWTSKIKYRCSSICNYRI